MIREGAIDGLSIGFKTVRATKDQAAGIRTIHEADLWEISVVTFPMLPEARVSEVKAGDNLPSIRTFEHWLTRDAGLSRSQARRVIAKGYASLKRGRDAATDTTMLTASHTVEERGRMQGMNDFLVFGGVTLASFSSGGLMNCSGGSVQAGWRSVNLAMLPFLVLAGGALIWLALRPKDAVAG